MNWRPDASDQLVLGITIAMFWNEKDHPVPHFHAEYAGDTASIGLDGTVIAGSLPRRQLQLVKERSALHREELLKNWERARQDKPLEPIAPLS